MHYFQGSREHRSPCGGGGGGGGGLKYMYIGADQTVGKRNNYFNFH